VVGEWVDMVDMVGCVGGGGVGVGVGWWWAPCIERNIGLQAPIDIRSARAHPRRV